MTEEKVVDVEKDCRKAQEDQIKKISGVLDALTLLKAKLTELSLDEKDVSDRADVIEGFWKDYEWQEWEPSSLECLDGVSNVLGEIESAIDVYQSDLETLKEELALFEEEPFDEIEASEEDDEESDDEEDEDDDSDEEE